MLDKRGKVFSGKACKNGACIGIRENHCMGKHAWNKVNTIAWLTKKVNQFCGKGRFDEYIGIGGNN
jgi:hypothetical protein